MTLYYIYTITVINVNFYSSAHPVTKNTSGFSVSVQLILQQKHISQFLSLRSTPIRGKPPVDVERIELRLM